MQDYGVNLICVEDGIDSSKEAGKLLISIIAAVAEMERENIRVQTMAGREQKAREGKWNGGFQFPVPIIKEGKEVAQIKGISLDKEKSDEHMISLEKLSTLGTVVLLFQLKQKPDDYINVTIELDDVDITSAETKATYDEIKKPIGILQGKSLPKILRQNKYVMNQGLNEEEK